MTGTSASEAWITGIGLVSSLGEGVETHWHKLTGAPVPVVDEERLKPYPVHPLCEIDYEAQIPGRGDRRQMGPWQLLGTYAAGLALTDAGVEGDAAIKGAMNLLVAGGVGERDHESDSAIFAAAAEADLSDAALNTMMMDTLRPTLFLAQLSNLLAGNISIVHGVTGSSRTLMGEEMAGVSAIEHATRRIRAGHDSIFLVGGSYFAELEEQLITMALGHHTWSRPYAPVWARGAEGGGAVTGSVGAFLVIEASDHARARGARAYARIDEVTSGRGPVSDQIAGVTEKLDPGHLLVISGATGIEPQTEDERAALQRLAASGFDPVVRAYASMLGLSLEAHFPAGIALAAIAAHRGAAYDPFDNTGFEVPSRAVPGHILVTATGQWRGSGAALVARSVGSG